MTAHCGRLLVGQGDETSDPLCLLLAGHDGPCSPERLCANPDCREPLDADRVLKHSAKTCGDKCRAAAWKASTGYGRPGQRRQSARSGPSGLQVSYRRALKSVSGVLWELGLSEARALALAEQGLRAALSDRQRARLDGR